MTHTFTLYVDIMDDQMPPNDSYKPMLWATTNPPVQRPPASKRYAIQFELPDSAFANIESVPARTIEMPKGK